MKILVTGASGFLGTALSRALDMQGHSVVRLSSRDGDLTRQGSLEPFSGQHYDFVYHLAAWTQAGDFCLYHPGEQWIINQQINTNVLAWWRERQPQAKLISMGSSCSYAPGMDLVEENYLEGRPIESLFTYGMTKRMLYTGMLALNRQFGLRYLHLVPSTLYGPGYHTDGRQMHFIFDLIRKILRGKLYGEPVVLWGDGYQRRELVYIDDFVEATLRLVEIAENNLINIGAGEDRTIREFAMMICGEVGYDFSEIEFDSTRYVGARSKCLRIERLRGLLSDIRQTPLQTGIRHTVQWFLQHRDAILLEASASASSS